MKPWKDYLTGNLDLKRLTNQLRFRPWIGNASIVDAPVYSRWGDGEFSAIFQDEVGGQNCDGHKYFPLLGMELELALRKQVSFGNQFYYGLVPVAVRVHGDDIQYQISGMFTEKAFYPKWVSGNILMEANREGKAGEFFKACRQYKMLYVGPERLEDHLRLDDFLNIKAWVTVPEVNAWLDRDRILNEIISRFFVSGCTMIGFSAGMMSKVLIMDLCYMLRKRIDVPIIDFGSMWDGYYGFNSRKYHHDYDWAKVREMNLGG